ncbi:HlyD family type I secretion periplasmic adaptor subunit [Pseudomonas entomophila]|uniref:HlyD family type I secretion periplasmic adaptor subunit n=1 Tax=Pseudomonas entomophila TaxID=312306 RepID=UPI001F013D3A|nr:HlyD family type I secretion periplasmic adaptor subunit [Pseudomonas entomophila]MCG8292076.1 HlyD family secretion protein [Pseudomonas entomophila]
MSPCNPDVAAYLEQPARRLPRVAIQFTVALLLAAMLAASLIRIDTVVTVTGRIAPEGKVKSIQAVETGEIKEVLVKEGQFVNKGERIALLDPQVSQAELAKLEALHEKTRLAEERVQASLNERPPAFEHDQGTAAREELELWRASERNFSQTLLDLERQTTIGELAIVSTQAEIQKNKDLLRIADAQEAAVRDSAGSAISRFKYMEYLDTRNRLRNEGIILKTRLRKERQELVITQGKVDALHGSRTEQLLKERENLARTLDDLGSELVKARRNSRLLAIESPEAGYITELKLTHATQMVKASEEITKLVPADANLVVRAKANSNDVGFLAVGAPAEVKVDAFPYQLYGSIGANLTWISADSEEDRAQAGGPGNRQYTLEAALGEWRLAKDLDSKVKPGMSVLMDIKTDKRSIASIIFNPITSSLRSSLRNN